MTTEAKPRDTILEVKLGYMAADLQRLRRNPVDGPMLSRFSYDHSNTIVHDSKGKRDLLIPNTVPMASDIARFLQHVSPVMVAELMRGYRLARAAGLLGDGRYNPATAQAMSIAVGKWTPEEHEANGVEQMAKLRDILDAEIKKDAHKTGVIPLNDPKASK